MAERMVDLTASYPERTVRYMATWGMMGDVNPQQDRIVLACRKWVEEHPERYDVVVPLTLTEIEKLIRPLQVTSGAPEHLRKIREEGLLVLPRADAALRLAALAFYEENACTPPSTS